MRSVLVVDDEQIIANTLAEILGANGFKTSTAYSGKEALKKIAEGCPDVLLCDVIMPDMNGIEIAKKMRITCEKTKIALISGNAYSPELVDQARSQGFDFTLLAKPIHPRALLQHLQTLA